MLQLKFLYPLLFLSFMVTWHTDKLMYDLMFLYRMKNYHSQDIITVYG